MRRIDSVSKRSDGGRHTGDGVTVPLRGGVGRPLRGGVTHVRSAAKRLSGSSVCRQDGCSLTIPSGRPLSPRGGGLGGNHTDPCSWARLLGSRFCPMASGTP
jgi:hypothetical protein